MLKCKNLKGGSFTTDRVKTAVRVQGTAYRAFRPQGRFSPEERLHADGCALHSRFFYGHEIPDGIGSATYFVLLPTD
ncbi:MAG TPA: hypothetical protein VFG54_00785 [Prolixibacteraceae bacterium]|nr:hypothetical protein [Prolixibacteraceae bacterium]